MEHTRHEQAESPPPQPKPLRLAMMVLVLSLLVTGGAMLATFPEHRLLVAGLVLGGAASAVIVLWALRWFGR